MEYKKKLIEVALPLEAINIAASDEKYVHDGHPSTLHHWWARRPLAAVRAVIWASLVDDPSSLPEQFPTEEAQNAERKRLFEILTELVKWENSNNQYILGAAKAEIMKSTDNNPPALLDPFAGGGAIPLEAQRLGLEAHASDLNPVAVLINKAMIEIPPNFTGQPPINPEACSKPGYTGSWKGAQGLAEDLRYYGEWIKKEAFKRIGHLYPKVKNNVVNTYLWARTVKCPNPACGCNMPLIKSYVLNKGKNIWIKPEVSGTEIKYSIQHGKITTVDGTVGQKINGARCVCCSQPVGFEYIRQEAQQKKMGNTLISIVTEGQRCKLYIEPSKEQEELAIKCSKPNKYPNGDLPAEALGFRIQNYGMQSYSDLFSNRQLNVLTTFGVLINEIVKHIEEHAIFAGLKNDGIGLDRGGKGATAYAEAICVYLSCALDKQTAYSSSVNSWYASIEAVQYLFARQAIPMSWDYGEKNIFSETGGGWTAIVTGISKCLNQFATTKQGYVVQQNASELIKTNVIISTDPPYYDNIGYADLSDYFYIWLRHSLKKIYPHLFSTVLVPKTEELIAAPYRFNGNKREAASFFENGMFNAIKKMNTAVVEDFPLTIYYAYKQSKNDDNEKTASTGWETMLSAIVNAGFEITGTWPMRTERSARVVSNSSNALASSIVLVCRKRPVDAPICTRRDFINALKRELKPALQKLQASNIAPVDLAQSAIGPGMGVYSRFSRVLEADGTPMSVRSALQIINQELDLYFTEQDGEIDRDSRFCIDLYTQQAFNNIGFGVADVLARAKNTSVEKLASRGVLYAQKGVVRLLTRDEIPENTDREILWLLTQQLTRAMGKEGVIGTAKIISDILTSEPEQAKALAYRLFTIAERKGWAQEAYAYNSLVIAWPDVQAKAAELQSQSRNAKQMSLFDTMNK